MIIEKTARNIDEYFKPLHYFDNAREAFKQLLFHLKSGGGTLFLPGYIGFSANEGSGIFDPVCETNFSYSFYPIDKQLRIDCDALEDSIKNIKGKKLLLLVHYFGYPDANINKIVEICQKYSVIIIEDAAHALFSDYIDHSCGKYGDYVIYSLHKMLPFQGGGMLKVNTRKNNICFKEANQNKYPLFDYDFYAIASRRKNNAKIWNDLLAPYSHNISILHAYSEFVTPQTFPVVINNFDRNELYFKLNEAGFGAVSLYHTMIEPIKDAGLDEAVWLSKHIINMPVHQDINGMLIQKMVEKTLNIINI